MIADDRNDSLIMIQVIADLSDFDIDIKMLAGFFDRHDNRIAAPLVQPVSLRKAILKQIPFFPVDMIDIRVRTQDLYPIRKI